MQVQRMGFFSLRGKGSSYHSSSSNSSKRGVNLPLLQLLWHHRRHTSVAHAHNMLALPMMRACIGTKRPVANSADFRHDVCGQRLRLNL